MIFLVWTLFIYESKLKLKRSWIIKVIMNSILSYKSWHMKKHTLRIRSILASLILGILVGSTINSLQANCIYSEELAVKELPVGNLLTWSTSSEVSNELFLLQKSFDGVNFTTVSFIRGAGMSKEEKQYRYLDLSIGENRVFYRLLDMDENEEFNFSKVVVLQRSLENNLLVTQLENEADQNNFRFSLESAIETDLDLRVFSDENLEVIRKQIKLIKGKNAVSIDAEQIGPGTYRLVVEAKGEKEEAFFIKDAVDKNSMRPVALKPLQSKN